MRYKPIALAAAALAASLAAAPASADLIPLTQVQLQGQGVGATFTTLFLQGAGASTTESGGVSFNGTTATPFGDAGTGASQFRSFTFADLAITNPSQLALIVNLAEPGSESPPSVTTAASTLSGTNAILSSGITLNVYSATGTLLEQHTAANGLTLNQVASGLGGSGLVFGLTAAEQTQLANTMAANAGNEVFTVGATFSNSAGGPETISAARLTQVAAVPEPETYALMLAGIGALGFVARRRRNQS
jgi:PEP-CTERM motif